MRKAREARAKSESEFVESARAWAKVKAKGEADIARLADKAREKSEFEAREGKNDNTVNRAEVEAAAKIRYIAKIQGVKIEKAEAEARKKVDAETKENSEKTRKARETKAKSKTKTEDETVERAREWAKDL